MKRIFLALVLLAIVGGAIGYYLYNKPPESLKNKKPDVEMTAAELLADFQKDEAQANQKYLGKILAVSGQILELIPGENLQMQVILETGDLMSRISCVLEEDPEAFLARGLKKGDNVRIKGECTGMTMDVVIEKAVVIE